MHGNPARHCGCLWSRVSGTFSVPWVATARPRPSAFWDTSCGEASATLPPEQAVYLRLAWLCGFHTGTCWCGVERLGAWTGLSRTTVLAALRRLRDRGLIRPYTGEPRRETAWVVEVPEPALPRLPESLREEGRPGVWVVDRLDPEDLAGLQAPRPAWRSPLACVAGTRAPPQLPAPAAATTPQTQTPCGGAPGRPRLDTRRSPGTSAPRHVHGRRIACPPPARRPPRLPGPAPEPPGRGARPRRGRSPRTQSELPGWRERCRSRRTPPSVPHAGR
jgi:hypothetical protein